MSKKRKKLRENAKKAKENDIKTTESLNSINPEEEESSQSFAANSESDRELEGEFSDMSNDEHEVDPNNEDHSQEVAEEHRQEYANAVEDSSHNSVQNSEDVPQFNDNSVVNHTEEEKKAEESPKKAITSQSSASSITESTRTRNKSTRRKGEAPPAAADNSVLVSPPSSTHSKQSSVSKSGSTSRLANDAASTSPGTAKIHLPANHVSPTVVQDPNRRTLIRISTGGSVQSGDTHGTYLGVEQSKFVRVVSIRLSIDYPINDQPFK